MKARVLSRAEFEMVFKMLNLILNPPKNSNQSHLQNQPMDFQTHELSSEIEGVSYLPEREDIETAIGLFGNDKNKIKSYLVGDWN